MPNNTHNYKKLIKPNELINFLNTENYAVIDTTGLIFDIKSFEWKLKKNNTINYFCTAIKTN